MTNEGLNILLDDWSKTGYLEPLLILLILTTFIIGTKKNLFRTRYKNWGIYCLSSLALTIYGSYSYFTNSDNFISEVSNVAFSIIEIFVFYHFFVHLVVSNRQKKIMFFLALAYTFLVFAVTMCFFLTTDNHKGFVHFSAKLNAAENIFILFFCTFYFRQLLFQKSITEIDLNSLMLSCGIFFYSCVLTPFFVVSNSLQKSNDQLFNILYAIHYISFGFLFIMLCKVFLSGEAALMQKEKSMKTRIEQSPNDDHLVTQA